MKTIFSLLDSCVAVVLLFFLLIGISSYGQADDFEEPPATSQNFAQQLENVQNWEEVDLSEITRSTYVITAQVTKDNHFYLGIQDHTNPNRLGLRGEFHVDLNHLLNNVDASQGLTAIENALAEHAMVNLNPQPAHERNPEDLIYNTTTQVVTNTVNEIGFTAEIVDAVAQQIVGAMGAAIETPESVCGDSTASEGRECSLPGCTSVCDELHKIDIDNGNGIELMPVPTDEEWLARFRQDLDDNPGLGSIRFPEHADGTSGAVLPWGYMDGNSTGYGLVRADSDPDIWDLLKYQYSNDADFARYVHSKFIVGAVALGTTGYGVYRNVVKWRALSHFVKKPSFLSKFIHITNSGRLHTLGAKWGKRFGTGAARVVQIVSRSRVGNVGSHLIGHMAGTRIGAGLGRVGTATIKVAGKAMVVLVVVDTANNFMWGIEQEGWTGKGVVLGSKYAGVRFLSDGGHLTCLGFKCVDCVFGSDICQGGDLNDFLTELQQEAARDFSGTVADVWCNLMTQALGFHWCGDPNCQNRWLDRRYVERVERDFERRQRLIEERRKAKERSCPSGITGIDPETRETRDELIMDIGDDPTCTSNQIGPVLVLVPVPASERVKLNVLEDLGKFPDPLVCPQSLVPPFEYKPLTIEEMNNVREMLAVSSSSAPPLTFGCPAEIEPVPSSASSSSVAGVVSSVFDDFDEASSTYSVGSSSS
jgi:hypothetical protein